MKKLVVVLFAVILVIACVVLVGCNTPRQTSVKGAFAQEQEVIYVVVTATPSADNCVCPTPEAPIQKEPVVIPTVTPVPTEVVVEAAVETEVAVEATEEVVATAEVTAEAEVVAEATEEVEVVAEATAEPTAEVETEATFEYEVGVRYKGNMNFPDFTGIPYGGGGFIYTVSPDAAVSKTQKVYGKCAIAQFAYNGKIVGSPLIGFIPEAYIPMEIQYEYLVEGLDMDIYEIMWKVVVHNDEEGNPGFALRAEPYNGQKIIAKIWLSEKENQYWELAVREDGTYVALTGTVASTYKQYVEAQIPVVEEHGGGEHHEHHDGGGKDTHFTISPTDPDPLPVNPDPIDWGTDEEWGKSSGDQDTDFTIG